MGEQGSLVFAGGTVITTNGERKADVVVDGGKVVALREPGSGCGCKETVDCSGWHVGPGLVDIHTHGGAGNDFVSTDPDEIARGVEYHLSQGTTSIAPSLLSVPFPQIAESIEATREAAKRCRATILGCHVEGVYLDKTYRKLQTSDGDARRMADLMKARCGLDQVFVLVNEQATWAAIRTAICQTLVRQTQPGDTVFIYWSGHGDRCQPLWRRARR